MATLRTLPLLALAVSVSLLTPSSAPSSVALAVPGTGFTSAGGAPLVMERINPLATTLSGGAAIVIGGHGDGWTALASAEVRNADGTWRLVSTPSTHDIAAVARVADGRLLVVGGGYDGGVGPGHSGADWIDGVTGQATAAGFMRRRRSACAAATLKDGRVLVVGGRDAVSTQRGEVFDPTTNAWTETQPVVSPRLAPIVVPCADGTALVLSGMPPAGGFPVASVEMLEPKGLTWVTVQTDLIVGDPGWMPIAGVDLRRPVDDQRTADGRYLLIARREEALGTAWSLFTVDPASKSIALVPTAEPLPAGRTYPAPRLDPTGRVAHLTAQSADDPGLVQVVSVDLLTGAVDVPDGWSPVADDQSAASAGHVTLADGRLMMAGGKHTSWPSDTDALGVVTYLTPDFQVPVPRPEAPSEITVHTAGAPALEVRWTDGSDVETGYRVLRRKSEGDWEPVATVGRDATSFTDRAVTPGAAYEYRVVAFNTTGEADDAPTAGGVAPSGRARVAKRVNFGKVRSGALRTRTVKVVNADKAHELCVELERVEGPFAVAPDAVVVAKGRTGRLRVTFLPSDALPAAGRVHLTSSDPALPAIVIDLKGRGTPARR